MNRPDSIYSQHHLDNWTDDDFAKHPAATRKTLGYLLKLETLRPESEYHEDMGSVLWWKVPIQEPPWVGMPSDLGKEVLIETRSYTLVAGESEELTPYRGNPAQRVNVGGWPGYHTHWSPLPKVMEP